MNRNALYALAAALLVGTSAIATDAALSPGIAQAVSVQPAIGNPLQAAKALAAKGDYKGAMARVREAKAVTPKTAAEERVVAQMEEYIAVASGGALPAGAINSATAAKAKFAADYRAKRYSEVIADAALLRKFGAYDFASQIIVAQAHYLAGDHAGAVRLLRTMGDGEQVQSLLLSAAHKAGDAAAAQSAARSLILKGQASHWDYLLGTAERANRFSDRQLLDLYRLRFLTVTMRDPDDYYLLAQLALQFGYPPEAEAVAAKGIAEGVLVGERATRLLALARDSAAKATPKADLDADTATIAGAVAMAGEGKTQLALNALAQVKGATQKPLAELWSLAIRTHGPADFVPASSAAVEVPTVVTDAAPAAAAPSPEPVAPMPESAAGAPEDRGIWEILKDNAVAAIAALAFLIVASVGFAFGAGSRRESRRPSAFPEFKD